MSADDMALRNLTGLVHGWTDAAVPRMARSGALAESPEVLSFSHILKRIAMNHDSLQYDSLQYDSLQYDSLQWRVSPKPRSAKEYLPA